MDRQQLYHISPFISHAINFGVKSMERSIMEEDEPMDVEHHIEPTPRSLGDSDIAAIIAAIKSDQPSTSTPTTASTPSFVRRGYASQYDFNITGWNEEGRGGAFQAILNSIKVRNETLKIADKHPGVFSFIDSKKQAEAMKPTDKFLSEFLEKMQKEEEIIKKKRSPSPMAGSRPFRGRDSAWRPDSRTSSYAPRFKQYQLMERMERNGYRRNFAPYSPYQKFYQSNAREYQVAFEMISKCSDGLRQQKNARPLWKEADDLCETAVQCNLPRVAHVIRHFLNSHRSNATFKAYTLQCKKFVEWWGSERVKEVPIPKARNLF
ncbi:hypothetical protein OSTOST_00402 [Ostertagia ostertagi]